MDIQKDKDFTSLPEIAKLYQACKERDLTIAEREYLKGARDAWQAAKAQAAPEGFVVVPREPYAYLIKHKLWKKDSDPEIFLAVDFLGDDGVEKDKLVVCKPLYLGDDEAQEQVG